MKTAVRYYSRSGHTKMLADAIANGAGCQAVSVDEPDAAITEPIDLLFIGGGLYAYRIDKHLKEYLNQLDASKIKGAAVFSTSGISKHSIEVIKKALKSKGIPVIKASMYAKGSPDETALEKAEEFAGRCLSALSGGETPDEIQ